MNTTGNIECVFDGICHLAESPVWNVEEQKLFWTDILSRRIWVYDSVKNSSRIFREGEHQVGGFAFTRKGGMVLCTDKGVYLWDAEEIGKAGAEFKTLFDIPMELSERFNDITVDPQGNIFAGTLRRSRPGGTLYRLEKNKEPVPVISGIACSNGMTFSMDEKTFFHTDTGLRRITRYEYCAATGEIVNPRVFFQGNEEQGSPDGLTLDTEDHIWIAFWGASMVRRLDPNGKIVEEVPLPARQPSSVMFGGRDLSELYITTACLGAVDIEKGVDENGAFLGGRVYRCQTQVTGRPEWLADFE